MPSKEVTDRRKDALAVITAAKTHGETVMAALSSRLGAHASKGQAVPDAGLLMALMASRLATTLQALETADRAHELELGDDAAPRERRDQAVAMVREVVVELRDQVASVLGDAALTLLGVSGETPTDPTALASLASGLLASLRDDQVKLPTPKRRMAKIDRAAMATELDAALKPLQTSLVDVARERREAEQTLLAKQQAMATHDEVFAQTTGLLVALFRAAGRADLADRVKPSRSRPGRTASDDPAPEPAPAPPGG